MGKNSPFKSISWKDLNLKMSDLKYGQYKEKYVELDFDDPNIKSYENQFGYGKLEETLPDGWYDVMVTDFKDEMEYTSVTVRLEDGSKYVLKYSRSSHLNRFLELFPECGFISAKTGVRHPKQYNQWFGVQGKVYLKTISEGSITTVNLYE